MIAAGEVVERPAAVVKELTENALDAGATKVTVELVSGGRQLIRVIDDGEGMDKDDVLIAIEPHATSKLHQKDDLNQILTYGFRGEALPSIGSISRMTIDTCAQNSPEGTQVSVHGGQLRNVQVIGRDRGTTVTVRDLFFNVPARRKFMRTEGTELRHCLRGFTALALGRWKSAMRLTHGDRVLIDCPAVQGWAERTSDIFGEEITSRSVEFDSGDGSVRVHGLWGKPGDTHASNPDQLIFVNGRSVTSRMLRKAVHEGYEGTMAHGVQPFYVVFLTVDPDQVDVNVHPQKREVRFPDQRAVYQTVAEAVKTVFRTADSVVAESSKKPEDDRFEPPTSVTPNPIPSAIPDFWSPGRASRTSEPVPTYVTTPADLIPTQLTEFDPPAPPIPAAAVQHQSGRSDTNEYWQVDNTYIFLPRDDGVWIVDQHVAHERILYEEAMRAMDGASPPSQRLLFPVTLILQPHEFAVLPDVKPRLMSMGFGIEEAGDMAVVVDAHPSTIHNWADGKPLRDMIAQIADDPDRIKDDLAEKVAISYACHTAIKAGDPLEPGEVGWLMDRLFTTAMPYVCPHGRPILVKITKDELAKRFGR
jgi:DNA mismatch repair protein MutL